VGGVWFLQHCLAGSELRRERRVTDPRRVAPTITGRLGEATPLGNTGCLWAAHAPGPDRLARAVRAEDFSGYRVGDLTAKVPHAPNAPAPARPPALCACPTTGGSPDCHLPGGLFPSERGISERGEFRRASVTPPGR
jgi:hypothetical protein